MKITFMMPADDLTGGNRVVATYARILRARGHEVLVVCNAPDRPRLRDQWRALRHGQWRAMRERMRPRLGHIALSGVPFKVLERPRAMIASDLPDADVLVATWWETAVWMHQMPLTKGRKVHLIQDYEVWTGDDDVTAQVNAVLRLPNSKIVISNELKGIIETRVGNLEVTLVPNAVDLQQFDAPPRQRGATPRVGYIYGRMPRKAADLIARACELARRQLPALEVLAFGAEQPTPELPLPAGATFFYRPPQDQIASLYAGCDAWLFGSRIDSFGLPILEAMACRTPVIGVPVGAAPELLADGVGILVPPESAEDMAAAIVKLCTLPVLEWQRMSDRAYERAHSYSWDDATDRFEAALLRATDEG